MGEEVIPIPHVADAAVAVSWYERLGFAKQWAHRFEPGLPAFVEVARGRERLFRSEQQGDAPPDTLGYLRVRDVAAAAFGMPVHDAPPLVSMSHREYCSELPSRWEKTWPSPSS